MSASIKGITIEIGADTTKLSSALAQANRSIRETDKDLRSVDKALKLDPTNIDLWKDKQNLLNLKIGETEKKLDALQKAQAELDSKNVDKNSTEYKELQAEIDVCTTSLKALNEQAKELGSAGAQSVAAMGEKVQEVGGKITDVGQGLTTSVTLPLAAIGTAGAAAFAEVDKTMSLTNATMKNTEDEADLLSQAMKDAAANSTFGMNDAATATLNFARAGLNAEQAAAALAPAMNLAAGEGGELDTVSGGLVATINGFHGTFDEAASYADVFAAACNNSALDVNSLSDAMSVAAPIFSSAGYQVQDAALYMGVMANNGIAADVAANSLKTGLARLVSPAKEGADMMKQLGIEVTNADGSMKDSADIQKDLNAAFSQLSESEQIAAASAIFGKNQMAPWLALINTSPESVNELSTALEGAAGTTDAMASAMMSGFGGSMESLKSSIDVAVTSIGEALAPAIQKVSDAIQSVITWFNNLSSEQQSVIATVGIAVAAIGPLLVVLGTVVSSVGSIMTMAPAISGALTAITGPIGIVVAAIAGIGAALVTLWNNNEEFRNNITGIWEGLKTSFEEFTGRIKGLLEDLGLDFGEADTIISGIWQGLCDFIAPVFETVFQGIATFLEGVMNTIAGIIEIATGLISGNWSLVWQGIVDTVTAIFETIKNLIGGALDTIKNLIGGALDTIKGFFTDKFELVKTTVSNAMDAVKGFFTDKFELIKTTVSDAMDAVKGFFTDKFELIKTTVSGALDAIKGFFTDKMELAKTAVSDAMDAVKGFFTDKLELIKTTVSGAMDTVKGFFTDGIDGAKTSVSDTLDNIKKAFTDKLDAAKTAVSKIIEKIKKLFDFSLKIDLKVPHISLTGGVAPFGIGGEGSLPKFDVKWYDQGGIFRHPSLIGVGEKRPEFVGALDDLREIVREESGAGASAQLLSQMVTLMGQLVEQGGRPITVNQTINAQQTSYAAQQREAAREFKQIARALA